METKEAATIKIHVTGFKAFHGVPENPTEAIVSKLKEFISRRGLPSGVSLESCTILETAGEGALPMLYQVLGSGIGEQVIWVHLGVNNEGQKFAIEHQAVNEATFRCPDELGWQPQKLQIIPEDGDISRSRQTSCCDGRIVEFLKKGYDVDISYNAGRFVCNYVYYHSLRFAEKKGHKSLFVHVPLFSVIDEDTQLQFVASLFEAFVSTS
ncbi:hypothetical protein C5167_023381 [Papaver somniferum]|uniref:Pyrrolidone-carboxylate peptidase n=1 Tax=Papaver somniferum TaxID=3469 RepID=A0A4Y7JPA8_PAPSO|nr:uncharacterized protein LOC113282437 isoform X2 [Papaver somniferum]RZC61638.1 hypothetical protein C5167_023381 [Papaver somniferum]